MKRASYMSSAFFIAQTGIWVREVLDCMSVVLDMAMTDLLLFACAVTKSFCC